MISTTKLPILIDPNNIMTRTLVSQHTQFMRNRLLVCIAIVWTMLVSAPTYSADAASASAVKPEADQLLRQMSDYLISLDQFSVRAENTEDVLLPSGQKLQMGYSVELFVRRPDRLRANVRGDRDNQDLFYDGETITLLDTDLNYYATIAAPPELDAALDYAMEAFNLRAPLSDLVYTNAYAALTENTESGFYVGMSEVRGVECHHLAFVQHDIDWQVWIENSETPLPRKLVITDKWVTGAPQFVAILSDWNVSPHLQDKLFTFVEPDKAEKIEFLPVDQTRMP